MDFFTKKSRNMQGELKSEHSVLSGINKHDALFLLIQTTFEKPKYLEGEGLAF